MKTVPILIFFLAGLPALLSAQDAIPAPPACDLIIENAQAELQKEADAGCKTAMRCVACTDKKSGAVVYANMVAHPKCLPQSDAKAAAAAPTDRKKPTGVTATATDTRPAPPHFEIIQERCEDGSGADLTVFIPGNAMRCSKDQYSFLWEIDGGKGGHAPDLQCACGKVAELTVTDIKTGLSQTKRLELLPCGKK